MLVEPPDIRALIIEAALRFSHPKLPRVMQRVHFKGNNTPSAHHGPWFPQESDVSLSCRSGFVFLWLMVDCLEKCGWACG